MDNEFKPGDIVYYITYLTVDVDTIEYVTLNKNGLTYRLKEYARDFYAKDVFANKQDVIDVINIRTASVLEELDTKIQRLHNAKRWL